jgi:cyclophilin family peptidyl-prolyl cis-trans isomerase
MIARALLQAHDDAVRQEFVAAQVVPLTMDMQRKVESLEKNNLLLQDHLMVLEKNRNNAANGSWHHHQMTVAQLDQQSLHYRQSIRKLSKYALLERFGNGPHYVEMQLAGVALDDTDNSDNSNKIILEMAPPDEMPHAVYWFLEHVASRLYDNGSSIHRSATAATAAPARVLFQGRGTTTAHHAQPSDFEQNVQFLPEEYHSRWTAHQKYTVCYTAPADSGPSAFYFNTLDNEPRNTIEAAAAAAANVDSLCFAKVIAGFDLVDAIQAAPSPTKPDVAPNHPSFSIVSMRLLKPNESQHELQQLLGQQHHQSTDTATATTQAL